MGQMQLEYLLNRLPQLLSVIQILLKTKEKLLFEWIHRTCRFRALYSPETMEVKLQESILELPRLQPTDHNSLTQR